MMCVKGDNATFLGEKPTLPLSPTTAIHQSTSCSCLIFRGCVRMGVLSHSLQTLWKLCETAVVSCTASQKLCENQTRVLGAAEATSRKKTSRNLELPWFRTQSPVNRKGTPPEEVRILVNSRDSVMATLIIWNGEENPGVSVVGSRSRDNRYTAMGPGVNHVHAHCTHMGTTTLRCSSCSVEHHAGAVRCIRVFKWPGRVKYRRRLCGI
ncbi:uncharacterized protein LOC116503991 [Thamnophis elegans]|uniref:uncharacterized protein LOC116503991 n=1 Tax=Thamnophis elegans TaxID=35005 RepID=UPI001376F1AA|nr:uncharacterized protein LOC116503991 [Thamnophis elegans]